MAGYTPIPNELLEKLIKAAKGKDRRAAVDAWILGKVCRRLDGWQGLQLGECRVTISEVAAFLNCSRGRASEILSVALDDLGAQKDPRSGLVILPNVAGALTEARTRALTGARKPPQELGLIDTSGAGSGADTGIKPEHSNRSNNQSSNLPTQKEKEPSLRSGSPLVGKESIQGVVDLWNQLTKGVAPFSQCLKLNPEREKTIRTRLKDPWWIENLEAGITAMIHDPWLLKGGSDGTFRPGINYLCREKTLLAAIEKASAPPPRNSNGTPTGSRAAADVAHRKANPGMYNPPAELTEEELSNAIDF